MNTLHNWDTLSEISLPEAVEVEAEVVADVAPVETFTTITFKESEAPGESFLLRVPRRTDSHAHAPQRLMASD